MDGRITQFNMSTTRGIQDITAISQAARATLQLLADHQDTFTILFDDASDNSFDVLKTIGTATGGRTITRTHSGQTLATESNLSASNWARSQSGEFVASVTALLEDGTAPTWS